MLSVIIICISVRHYRTSKGVRSNPSNPPSYAPAKVSKHKIQVTTGATLSVGREACALSGSGLKMKCTSSAKARAELENCSHQFLLPRCSNRNHDKLLRELETWSREMLTWVLHWKKRTVTQMFCCVFAAVRMLCFIWRLEEFRPNSKVDWREYKMLINFFLVVYFKKKF